MKTNLNSVCPRTSLPAGAFALCWLPAAILLAQGANGVELRAVRNQGRLELAWDDLNAKLQQALILSGPWQMVNTAGVSSCRTRITGPQKFYRLTLPPAGKKWLTVAAVTMTSKTNTDANLQTLFAYMEQAATNRVDLIVFPEMALQGCPGWREDSAKPSSQEMAYTRQTAETVPGPSTSNVVAKAKPLNLFVVFGLTEKDSAGLLYNTSVFLGPEGVIARHRKSFFVGNDASIWHSGPGFQAFDTPLGKVGLIICAELSQYPGPIYARQGANLLVTSSAWWTSVGGSWDLATNANARQANRWHVAAEQVGLIGHAQCYGHSRVVDPLGEVVCDSGMAQGLVTWATDILIDALPH